MTLTELQAAALKAREDRAMAVAQGRAAGLHLADPAGFLASLPPGHAVCGAVSLGTIIPENRAAWRRRHIRFQYRVAGRLVSEAEACAALNR